MCGSALMTQGQTRNYRTLKAHPCFSFQNALSHAQIRDSNRVSWGCLTNSFLKSFWAKIYFDNCHISKEITKELTVSRESAPSSENFVSPETFCPSANASCFLTIAPTFSTVSGFACSSRPKHILIKIQASRSSLDGTMIVV